MSMNPYDFPDAYDALIIAGVKTPGVVTLSGHQRTYNWDVKEGQGQSGASTTLKGDKPSEITASFYLLAKNPDDPDRDEFQEWAEIAGLLRSSVTGTKPKALEVYHPDLIANWIGAVVLSEMGGLVHDGKGGATVTVKLLEYRPPKPAGGSPKKAATKKPDPDQAKLDEIAKLTDQYKQTPWGNQSLGDLAGGLF